jgi:hypothetical protein
MDQNSPQSQQEIDEDYSMILSPQPDMVTPIRNQNIQQHTPQHTPQTLRTPQTSSPRSTGEIFTDWRRNRHSTPLNQERTPFNRTNNVTAIRNSRNNNSDMQSSRYPSASRMTGFSDLPSPSYDYTASRQESMRNQPSTSGSRTIHPNSPLNQQLNFNSPYQRNNPRPTPGQIQQVMQTTPRRQTLRSHDPPQRVNMQELDDRILPRRSTRNRQEPDRWEYSPSHIPERR